MDQYLLLSYLHFAIEFFKQVWKERRAGPGGTGL